MTNKFVIILCRVVDPDKLPSGSRKESSILAQSGSGNGSGSTTEL
jgi:hypothetical protein